MSLLLDALKKAADDKERKSREAAATAKEKDGATESNPAQQEVETLSLQPDHDARNFSESQSVNPASSTEELSLDAIETTPNEVVAEEKNAETVSQQERELSLEKKEKADKASGRGRFAISDDALSMLIYKTNHDVKRGKWVFYSSVLILSLFVMVSGGIYYYMDMETEIEALERKHQIAMQSMRSKTNKEKTPGKSEIIRNLVTDSELEAKVEYEQRRTVSQRSPVKPSATEKPSSRERARPEPAASRFSIERTNKVDTVGAKLTEAWLAYEEARYAQAKQLYKAVLVIEKNNRDALLGLGAIAVIEKEHLTARETYLSLLELDPRDPIATAALASLHSDDSSLASDEAYLLSMLKKNPEASHLHFALGNVYAKLNKWSAAQQHYFNAWQHDVENADYIFNLAVSMDQMSKRQQAIAFYKDSLLKASDKQVSFSREAVQKRINELTRL